MKIYFSKSEKESTPISGKLIDLNINVTFYFPFLIFLSILCAKKTLIDNPWRLVRNVSIFSW